MSGNKKKILLFVTSALLITVSWIFFKAFIKFSIEDNIHKTYAPVVAALDDYTDLNKKAPESLSDLVPAFLPKIPTSENVSHVGFLKSENGAGWRLLLLSNKTGQTRVYFAHHKTPPSPAEKEAIALTYHNLWIVLEGTQAESLATSIKGGHSAP
ncbi:MAG: hypothetical protein ACSHYF_16480 [Verrucomicrobiaceae bacterium]